MPPISATIITHNEAANIARAIRSLDCADEILVVDSGSTDATVKIASELGARTINHPWEGFAAQKSFAVAQASHDWILSLDADEELSSPLQTSLLSWKKHEPKFSVYEIARKTWYLGAWIEHSGWYPDFQRRLYRRETAQFSGMIHEALRFEGQAGRLPGDLLHYTVRSFAEHEEKVEQYTTLAAQQMFESGKRNWRAAMWLATPWSWFQNFFLRGGCMDGYRGALISQMAARSVRLKYAKLGKLVRETGETNTK